MRAQLIILASLFVAGAGHAAPLPDGWTVYPTPPAKACAWQRANYSERTWRVRLEGERLVIEPTSVLRAKPAGRPTFVIPHNDVPPVPGEPCDDCVVRVADGWLVGFDFGEWGGGLWWTDANGGNAYPIMAAGRCGDIADTGPPTWGEKPGVAWQVSNVSHLSAKGARVFSFGGSAHLSISTGEVSRVERREGKWQACMLRNLEGAPEAVADDGHDAWLALIAGGIVLDEKGERAGVPRDRVVRDDFVLGDLVSAHADGRLQRLMQPAFLAGYLYPNSMVKLRDGTLYVGMRHFVARLTPKADGAYVEELLLEKGRPAFDYEPWIDGPASESGPTVLDCPPRQ